MNPKRLFAMVCVTLFAALSFRGDIAGWNTHSMPAGVVDPVPGDLYILSVGINKSFGRDIPNQRYAVGDAESLSSEFGRRGAGYYGNINKTVLLDGQATKSTIEAALNELARRIRPEDTFIFCYAGMGHAYTDATRQTGLTANELTIVAEGDTDFYLFPADTDRENLRHTAISGRLLRSYFRKIQARNQLILLDSCGSAFAFESLASRLVEQDATVAGLLDTNVLFLGTDNMTFEDPSLGHGIITAAVLDALAGSADVEGDGAIMSYELEAHLYRKVLELTLKISRQRTHPRTITRGSDFFLAFSDKKLKERAAAKNPPTKPPSRGSMEVDDDSRERAEQRQGRDYALLFATDQYQGGWAPLSNPVKDATAISEELVGRYGYVRKNVRVEPNRTKTQIFDTIREYQRRAFEPDDQLFIFFAGHGTTKDLGQGQTEGYLVTMNSPSDLNDETENGFIQLDQLVKMINLIKCEHIFVVFDACYVGKIWQPTIKPVPEVAGLFDAEHNRRLQVASLGRLLSLRQASSELRRANSKYTTLAFSQDERKCRGGVLVKRVMKNRTRLLLTSGSRPVLDGDPNKHSPFALAFLSALRSGGGNDCLLTTKEIFASIEEAALNPEPQGGSLSGSDGGFIFIAPK